MFALFQSARKTLRCLVLPFLALGLAACDDIAIGGLGNPGPSTNKSEPVPVALLVPRGGGSASDDLLAQSLENAARLAIRDLKGVKIDLRVYGTGGNAATAATQATQAVSDGAKIIIGPLYAEAANAAGVAIANTGVNVLAFSNNTTIAGGNVFILGSTFDNTANRLISYAKTQGKDKIVVVSAQDVAGQLGRNAIQSAITNSGSTLAGTVDYPLSQEGVIAAIPKIKAAVENSGANAVFMTSPTSTELPLLAQMLPEAGVTSAKSQFIGLTRWDIPVQTLATPGVQGGWFALPDPARTAAFRSKYEAAYGKAPHPIAGLSFDGIAAVGALVSGARSNPLGTGSLTQGAGFQGATGAFRLRTDGTNQRGLAVAAIQNKQVVILDNAPTGFGGPGF